MCSLILLAAIALFGFFGISTVSEFAPGDPAVELGLVAPSADAPTVISCEPLDPAVDRALVDGYHRDVLTPDAGWTYTPDTGTLKTLGTWMNDQRGSVAYMELLHYDCGVPSNAVSRYFNPSSYDIFFADYDRYELLAVCGVGQTQHFIFETSLNGVDYETRYWFEPLEARRLAMFMLTTPVSQAGFADRLTRELYPSLPNCQSAG
jgi:hypothetical protein